MECDQAARLITSHELGLSTDMFPEACPFKQDDVLNPQYLPED